MQNMFVRKDPPPTEGTVPVRGCDKAVPKPADGMPEACTVGLGYLSNLSLDSESESRLGADTANIQSDGDPDLNINDGSRQSPAVQPQKGRSLRSHFALNKNRRKTHKSRVNQMALLQSRHC